MRSCSRREFLGYSAALLLFPALDRLEPETILYNGNIWTVNPRAPRAQAVAIAAGRFTAVGCNDEGMNLASARARAADLGRKTVLPCYIDAHSHPARAAPQ